MAAFEAQYTGAIGVGTKASPDETFHKCRPLLFHKMRQKLDAHANRAVEIGIDLARNVVAVLYRMFSN